MPYGPQVFEERKAGIVDGEFIADMVIPLQTDAEGLHWYTCRHLDTSTGLCTVYAQRPAMCRDFPYGTTCQHCGYKDRADV